MTTRPKSESVIRQSVTDSAAGLSADPPAHPAYIPRLIKTEAEYREAIARLEQISLAEPDTPEGDEAELLTVLTEHYEEKNPSIPPASQAAVLRFCMDQQELSKMDLVPYIGSVHKVNEVLEGKRPLSLSMIQKLAPALHISHHLLLPRNGEPEFDGEPHHHRVSGTEMVSSGLGGA